MADIRSIGSGVINGSATRTSGPIRKPNSLTSLWTVQYPSDPRSFARSTGDEVINLPADAGVCALLSFSVDNTPSRDGDDVNFVTIVQVFELSAGHTIGVGRSPYVVVAYDNDQSGQLSILLNSEQRDNGEDFKMLGYGIVSAHAAGSDLYYDSNTLRIKDDLLGDMPAAHKAVLDTTGLNQNGTIYRKLGFDNVTSATLSLPLAYVSMQQSFGGVKPSYVDKTIAALNLLSGY